MEYQKDFYASESGAQFPSGTPKKAVSGNGNTTSKGTFTPEIDFEKLYGATTPATDAQFVNAIISESAGLPKAAPKNSGNSKPKKGY
jgi:hypothetical protein